jgi:hypothetical protein
VNFYQLCLAAIKARPGRKTIITDAANFPTDRYILDGIAKLLDLNLVIINNEDSTIAENELVTPELLEKYMSEDARLDELRQRLKADYDDIVGDDWDSIYNDKFIDANELSLSKKELRELLTLYIGRAKRWMEANSEKFIKILASKKYGQTDYNELVINEIELIAAIANIVELGETDDEINQMKRNIESAVGPDNVVYVDSSKNPKQAKAAVTNFIIGHGGKIN